MRKGSLTAHTEIHVNPPRSLSSTLTLVPVHPNPRSDPTNRVSFAFSSFSPANSDQPPSPSSSPPRFRGRSDSLSSKPRLTPDQLVDLARQATNPKSLPVYSISPFTPLPDDIHLPFIDRPSEVAALISSPPVLKLFSLLAQTFPNNITITDKTIQLPSDPAQWSYHHLIHHLTHIDRDIAPDPIWAIAARNCIHPHSELIWQRIKGALGVPPELDHDQHSPPHTTIHQKATLEDVGPDYLSIEPLLASSASTSFSSLSNHHSSGDALGDIAEGAEDETELVSNTETGSGLQGAEDPRLSSPIQIQGLKISTSPIPSSHSYGTPIMSPISPLPPAGTRSDAIRQRDGGCMGDSDRLPGYPLFPSNFTRLAMGPILRANLSDLNKPRAYSDTGVL